MSYRTAYLIAYDISDNKLRHRAQKFLQGFKIGGQRSLVECWLTPPELLEVQRTLLKFIDTKHDRLHIFQLDPRLPMQAYGQAKNLPMATPFLVL